jgi:hypothetical protein
MSLLSMIGLRPDGDPAAMCEYAVMLHGMADDVQSSGEGAAHSLDTATFVGPAGEATRRRAAALRARSRTAAGELRDLADAITRRAHDVEHRQHTWDRTLERVERAARDATGL